MVDLFSSGRLYNRHNRYILRKVRDTKVIARFLLTFGFLLGKLPI